MSKPHVEEISESIVLGVLGFACRVYSVWQGEFWFVPGQPEGAKSGNGDQTCLDSKQVCRSILGLGFKV